MDFNNVKFLKSYHRTVFNITGLNPKILGQSFHMGMYYNNPHEDLTLLTWYMDKNRPLPSGNVFDEYREKDFERRKSEGFRAPIYPSSKYICDANSGYMNGTEEFKKEIKSFKLKIEDAHAKVLQYLEKDGEIVLEPYKLCFLGLYQDQMVFKRDRK